MKQYVIILTGNQNTRLAIVGPVSYDEAVEYTSHGFKSGYTWEIVELVKLEKD